MSSSVGVSPGGTGRQPRDIADPDKRRAAEIDRAKFLSETRKDIAELRSRKVTEVPKGVGAVGSMLGGVGGLGGVGSALSAIGEMVRENIVSEIEKGATPIRVTDESGKKITVGALRGEKYTGRSEYEAIARETGGTEPIQISEVQARQPTQERDETATIITPEVTPEVTPEADAVMLGEREKTRRRRAKRAGAAGTLLEGGGVLYE